MTHIHLDSDHLDDPVDIARMQENLDAITANLTDAEINTLTAVINHQRSLEANACAMENAGECM